jgi:hypothetical protein
MQILIFFLALFVLLALVFGLLMLAMSWDDITSRKYRRNQPHAKSYSIYRPGTFCGAFGSPGMSPKIVGSHFRDCQCMICYYGHDPDKEPDCQCRSCQADRRGQPLF